MFAFFNLSFLGLIIGGACLLVFVGVGVALLFMFFGKSNDEHKDD